MKKLILFLSVSFVFVSCEKDDFQQEQTATILEPAEVDYSIIPYYDTYSDTLSTRPNVTYEY